MAEEVERMVREDAEMEEGRGNGEPTRMEEGDGGTQNLPTNSEIDSDMKGENDVPMGEVVGMLMKISEGGTHAGRMKQEARKMNEALQVDMAEVFSPPRVTAEGKNWGFRIGEAMDLLTGWDFNKLSDRKRAQAYIEKYRPRLIIGSPSCTAFSQLQNLNPDSVEKQRKWREGCRHLKFVVELYKQQMEAGRWFLHEHPAGATSWGTGEIRKLMEMEGVQVTVADQCMYGLVTNGVGGRETPAQKKTKFMTNSPCIAKELQRKCDGKHVHQPLIGGRAAGAARYPRELCRAICQGLMEEMRRVKEGLKKVLAVKPGDEVGENGEHENWNLEWAVDDLTGCELDGKAVKAARRKEMGYIYDKKVWKKISRAEAKRQGWKIIKTRWIDINKGDSDNPDIRSRLVGKEFNNGEEDGLFAATPPLEALRLLVSDAATKGRQGRVIMINDVSRAFFEAPMKRMVCVELPDEAKNEGEGDVVGLLQMSLYGTRDAAVNFQEEVGRYRRQIGFRQGKYNPCTYYHAKRGLRTMVYGGDLLPVVVVKKLNG